MTKKNSGRWRVSFPGLKNYRKYAVKRAAEKRFFYWAGTYYLPLMLYLDANQIEDISFLKNLPRLTSLSLKDNQISDISLLSTLENLDYLDLSNNPIEDSPLLRNLKESGSLKPGGKQITELYL